MWRKDVGVNHFDLAQAFIEQCRAGAPVGDLVIAFQQSLEAMGFRYFACCSHVDPLRPPRGAVMLYTYPREWARACSELDFYYIDPVYQHAERTLAPFFWDDPAFRADLTQPQLEILSEAKRYGIDHGYTVPIHPPRSLSAFRASCSVVPDSERLDSASYAAVQLMSCYMYETATQESDRRAVTPLPQSLSRRERQCLELAAQGKSDWAVGKILGISERTVHNHIENAKRRLGVATRVQAIVHALVSRQISFGDVIRSENSERAVR